MEEEIAEFFEAADGKTPLYFFQIDEVMWWISNEPITTPAEYLIRCKKELPANETCPKCGQPDSYGDCNCEPLTLRDWEIIFPKKG